MDHSKKLVVFENETMFNFRIVVPMNLMMLKASSNILNQILPYKFIQEVDQVGSWLIPISTQEGI